MDLPSASLFLQASAICNNWLHELTSLAETCSADAIIGFTIPDTGEHVPSPFDADRLTIIDGLQECSHLIANAEGGVGQIAEFRLFMDGELSIAATAHEVAYETFMWMDYGIRRNLGLIDDWPAFVAAVLDGREPDETAFARLFARMQREAFAVCHQNHKPQADGDAAKRRATRKPAKPLIEINLQKRTVRVQSQTFDCDSVQALRWVKVLNEHAGEWIAERSLGKHDDNLNDARTRDLKPRLPEPLQSMIESKSGAGSRLNLPSRRNGGGHA